MLLQSISFYNLLSFFQSAFTAHHYNILYLFSTLKFIKCCHLYIMCFNLINLVEVDNKIHIFRWVSWESENMVESLKTTVMIPSLPAHTCNMLLLPSGYGICFPSLWIWTGRVTCYDQKNTVEKVVCLNTTGSFCFCSLVRESKLSCCSEAIV